MNNSPTDDMPVGSLLSGLIFGLLVGGVLGLFFAPGSGRSVRQQLSGTVNDAGQTLKDRIDQAVPTDPVAESLAEGKAAARRRRAERDSDDQPPASS